MGRLILGIVGGYLVMTIWVMATISLAWMLVGADFAFRPGTTEVTAGWIAINIPLSFVGAYLGGSFARRLGRDRGQAAVGALAILVLVFGLVDAFIALFGDRSVEPMDTTDGISMMEASAAAIQPLWYKFVIPFVGVVGVLLGGRRRPSE
jgi:hypothetical protein